MFVACKWPGCMFGSALELTFDSGDFYGISSMISSMGSLLWDLFYGISFDSAGQH